jgi:N-acetylated-alpha-linked acidic dipeptidase
VIGEIKGEQFPDEMILIGNHRDAWVFGAADPNSGTGLVCC